MRMGLDSSTKRTSSFFLSRFGVVFRYSSSSESSFSTVLCIYGEKEKQKVAEAARLSLKRGGPNASKKSGYFETMLSGRSITKENEGAVPNSNPVWSAPGEAL